VTDSTAEGGGPDDAAPINFSELAAEDREVAMEEERQIVEHIAHEHDFPDQPAAQSVDEQLEALNDRPGATQD
jgi:hypothetical protein